MLLLIYTTHLDQLAFLQFQYNYKMKLSKVTEDDLGVIGNYLIELMEQNKLDNIKEVVSSIDKVLLNNESWKVEVGDKIVAFACVKEINSEVAKVANF